MTPTSFLDDLSSVCLPNVFNPYVDVCPDYDLSDAPLIRRNNLEAVLEFALSEKIDVLWVARDLGYRGGRRTGLALTDEAHLDIHSRLYGNLPLARSTKGPILAERTASVIWNMLGLMRARVFLWNIFPFHPYKQGDQTSNRCHTKKEADISGHFLMQLISALKPSSIVGIGQEAQCALAKLSVAHTKARHPSFGGKKAFETSIIEQFALNEERILCTISQFYEQPEFCF